VQATTPEDGQTSCESLKKGDMAARAEKLVTGKLAARRIALNPASQG
jgi:hypothetical protein